MLKTKNKLTILDDNNSVFSDFSIQGLDFDRDQFTITLDKDTSYFYVGFYKPIRAFYVELGTPNLNVGNFTAQYYNGTAFVDLVGLYDESACLTRSGFIQWDKNQTDETETTIDSEKMYFYRFRPSVSHSATVINGLNIVFSDDTDLKREFFEIYKFKPAGENSHILSHVAARDEIIQVLRGSQTTIKNNGNRDDLNAFDLHDIGQIKTASTYLTLSKIFSSVTDDNDDIYKTKAAEYRTMYSIAIKTPYIDIDENDNGKKEQSESKQVRTVRFFRE